MKRITILGSTGSIGVNTLDVLARHPDKYELIALTANKDIDGLLAQCLAHRPKYAVMADADSAEQLAKRIKQQALDTEVLAGSEALVQVAGLDEVDYVMAAIVGAAGLLPTLAAAQAGKRVLLANKEALVMSGKLFMDTVAQNQAELLPIDSEHNAIFQCMPQCVRGDFGRGLEESGVTGILLTASGGPFRTLPLEALSSVTVEQALAHPNWDMGRKISIDSASMMNKGLELIEACWLFHTRPESIQVVIHPQSVIHSMVQYADGSVLAQLGNPDMRTPIAHALAWPQRMAAGVAPLDLFDLARLDFAPPDLARFPCLRLAGEAMQAGGTATAVLNAANEVAVAEFLHGRIRFTDIAGIIEASLAQIPVREAEDLEAVMQADTEARHYAENLVRDLAA